MDRGELMALADKLERYTPSGRYDIDNDRRRELNEEIAKHIGMPFTVKLGDPILGNERMGTIRLPDFVGSLDAAMNLMPKNWCIASMEWWPMTSTKASVKMREVRETEDWIGYDETCGTAHSRAGTPALCIAAAALRAKATGK